VTGGDRRSALARLVEPSAVLVGALVALAVAVPAALLAQTLDEAGSVDDDSGWLLVLFVVILAGMAAGGYVAAYNRPDAPLTNSALAALTAYLVVQGIGAVRLVLAGEPVTWVAIPFFALLSSASGMTGGLIADRRARRPRRRDGS
jgi:hypothetical protein